MELDSASVRTLQTICLRLERLVSGAVAKHGRASDQSMVLLSLPIKDNADMEDLTRIADNCIARIEVMPRSISFADGVQLKLPRILNLWDMWHVCFFNRTAFRSCT